MRHLLTGLFALLTLGAFYSCQKELSIEYGSAAKGSLQSSAGDCLPKTVNGGYVAAKALNDTNYIDVTVTVTSAGPYTIYTDTLNGYAFKATGTFTAAGQFSVRLKGNGAPVTAGNDAFTVYFDSSYCDVNVTVLPAGSTGGAAVYSLANTSGACNPFIPSGNFIKDTTLTAANYVTVTVNVTTVGTYSINTTSVNGYFFSGTGTFGATGSQTIKLFGNGKPVAAGTDAFTATGGTSTCNFNITVTATAPTNCNPAVQGTFTAGTANTAANKVTLTHTYATAGSVTVNTNTVNGYSFGPSTFSATAGSNTITLTATGTPAAAGTDNFTVNFGDGQTCNFSVTVGAGTVVTNTDYFPTTQGSYWTYYDDSGVDTFKVTVNGTGVYTGVSGPQTYQKFVSVAGPYFRDDYYRKDPVTKYYFRSVDTADYDPTVITFPQPRLNDFLFLKDVLTNGATYNTDDYAASISGVPAVIGVRYDYSAATNLTKTVNGNNFTNVYKITETPMAKLGPSVYQAAGSPTYYYYAKGVGLIQIEDNTGAVLQSLRYWHVN